MAPTSVPCGPLQTKIYNPPAVGTPNAFIANNGSQPVYLGQLGVTYATGFVLYPGQVIDLAKAPAAIYGICGVTGGGTSTTLSAAAAVGAGTVNTASTSGFSAGQTLLLDTTTAAEVLVVNTVPNGTTVTFTTGTTMAHASGATLALTTAILGTSVNVNTGTY